LKHTDKLKELELHLQEKYSEDISSFSFELWSGISTYYFLSEEFIEKYSNQVDWRRICANQKLSEQFIEKIFR